MKIIIHTDDIGLSEGITDRILDCVDHGIVTSVSIIPNGHAFSYTMDALKKRPNVQLSVHLNLREGCCLADPNDIDLLVDKVGSFNHSFISLWSKYLFGSSIIKKNYKAKFEQKYRFN